MSGRLTEIHVIGEVGDAAIYILLRDAQDVEFVLLFDPSVAILRGDLGAG